MKRLVPAAISIAIFSSGVGAATVEQSTSIGPPIFNTVNDTSSGGGAVTTPLVTRPLSFNEFSADTGVLTGVSSNLFISGGILSLHTSSETYDGSGIGSFASTGSISASSNLSGLAFGPINNSLSNACGNNAACFSSGALKSLDQSDTSWLSPTVAVAASNLNAYVGPDSLASTLTVTNSVSLTSSLNILSPQATVDITGLTGSQSLTYTYLNHANASFTGGLDTNAMTRDVTAGAFAFSVFDFGVADTTKLDFVSTSCVSGDCAAFALSLPSFEELVVGSSVGGSARLGTASAGTYRATYALLFADTADVGATRSHEQNSLLLNLNGTVVSAIPEPETYALMLVGLTLLGFVGRHRKQ